MAFPLTLKLVGSTALFAIGIVASGDWHKAVLDHYSVNCTLWPDPQPYPQHLILLADGKLTVKGLKELLACDSEPQPGWEAFAKLPRPHIVLGDSGKTQNPGDR